MWPATKLTVKDLAIYLIVYPFVIRIMYLIWQSFDPMYMNSTCLMDFVRVSSPDHYAVHPIWRFFQRDVNETCEELTGMPIEDHFLQVYHNGRTEFFLFYAAFLVYAVYGVFSFGKKLFSGKINGPIQVLAAICMTWNEGSLMHLFSHYQNDCSHLNGNVMHHSSFTVAGDNSSLNVTLPPGLLINFLYNRLIVWMVFYVMLDYFKIDKWMYFNVSGPVFLFKFFLQMKVIHPYIHMHHKSWYRTFIHPAFPMDEYTGHVLCHHVSGYCLGDSPVYTYIYDRMLYFHGLIYEHGYVKYRSLQHYMLNFGIDYLLIVLLIVFSFLTVLVFSPFLQKVVPSPKSAKKAN